MSERTNFPSGSSTYRQDVREEARARHLEDAKDANPPTRNPKTPARVGYSIPPSFGRSPQLAKPFFDRINHDFFKETGDVKAEKIRAALAMELYKAIHYDIESLYDDIVEDSLPFIPQDIMKCFTARSQPPRTTPAKLHYIQTSKLNAWIDWPDTNTPGKEDKLCVYLNGIADSVRRILNKPPSDDDLIFSSVFKEHGPDTGHTTDRKPDLVVIPRSQKDVTWADFRCVVSLKIANQGRAKECSQIMEYARCCFSERPDRRYVLGLGFLHNNLSFYVFDRSGILATPYYNVDQYPEKLLQLAIGILFMNDAQLGYDTSFYQKEGLNYIKAGGEEYEILCRLFIDKSLRGRGTVCIKAMDKVGRVVVIKDSWVDRTRGMKEVDMLKLLQGSKIDNIPELFSDEIVSFPGETTGKDCTENLRRKKILEELKDKDRDEALTMFRETELRDHYRIVQGPYGEPLDDFDSLPELLSAAYDILDAIEALNKMGIVHRDVSLNNIILVPKPHMRLRKGYLIDFDYAIKKNDIGEAAIGPRTGTIAFMAIDVLEKAAKHSFIHDAESILYILIFIACNQGGPHFALRPDGLCFRDTNLGNWCPVGEVNENQLESIASSKQGVMQNEELFKKKVFRSMFEYFYPLRMCFLLIRRALFPPLVTLDTMPVISIDEAPTPSADEIDRRNADALKKVKAEVLASLKALEKEEEARAKITGSGIITSEQVGETKTETTNEVSQLQDTNADGGSSTIPRYNTRSVGGQTRDRTGIRSLRLRDVIVAPDDLSVAAKAFEDLGAQSLVPAPEPTYSQQTRRQGASFSTHSSTQSLRKRARELEPIPTSHFYGNADSVKRSRGSSSWKPDTQSLGEKNN